MKTLDGRRIAVLFANPQKRSKKGRKVTETATNAPVEEQKGKKVTETAAKTPAEEQPSPEKGNDVIGSNEQKVMKLNPGVYVFQCLPGIYFKDFH